MVKQILFWFIAGTGVIALAFDLGTGIPLLGVGIWTILTVFVLIVWVVGRGWLVVKHGTHAVIYDPIFNRVVALKPMGNHWYPRLGEEIRWLRSGARSLTLNVAAIQSRDGITHDLEVNVTYLIEPELILAEFQHTLIPALMERADDIARAVFEQGIRVTLGKYAALQLGAGGDLEMRLSFLQQKMNEQGAFYGIRVLRLYCGPTLPPPEMQHGLLRAQERQLESTILADSILQLNSALQKMSPEDKYFVLELERIRTPGAMQQPYLQQIFNGAERVLPVPPNSNGTSPRYNGGYGQDVPSPTLTPRGGNGGASSENVPSKN